MKSQNIFQSFDKKIQYLLRNFGMIYSSIYQIYIKLITSLQIKIPQQLIYMDSTTYTSCQNENKKNSKYYEEDDNEQFYSFHDCDFSDSVTNELAFFKDHIKTNLYPFEEENQEAYEDNEAKNSKNKLKKQRDNQFFVNNIVKGNQIKGRQQASSITHYASLQKRSSEQSLQFDPQKFKNSSPLSPTSQNRVSLLQSSLQLEKKFIQPQKDQIPYKRILNLKSQKSSKFQKQQAIQSPLKAYPPSPQKTNISDKFNLPFNLVIMEQKSNQAKNNNSQKKIKNYRIQKPDQVYVELEQELQKQKAGKIKQKEKQAKISVIVRQNINNTRAMLEKNSQNKQTLNQNNLPIPKQLNQQSSKFPVISLSNNNSPGKFPVITSTCLFRLPSPSLYKTLKQFYTNEYYHKYCYQISQEQLIIDNSYHIKYEDITKIKMIYNQFNRPEVKITYSTFKYYEIDPEQRNRRLANVNNQISGKQAENNPNKNNDIKSKARMSFCVTEEEMKKNSEEMVVYLCQCYESVYTIFSCIIMRKMMTLVRNRFAKKQIKNVNLNNPYNLSSFIVNTNLINTKKHTNDNNTESHISFDYKIEGVIFKRSKHVKKWDSRYAKIENFVLKSYRLESLSEKQKQQRQREREKGKKPRQSAGITSSISSYVHSQSSKATHINQYSSQTVPIPQQDYKISAEHTFQVENIKELWTRFDTVDRKFLVVKLFRKNKFEKVQLGIPITNFCDIVDKNNWMFGLVSILKGDA